MNWVRDKKVKWKQNKWPNYDVIKKSSQISAFQERLFAVLVAKTSL